MARSKSLAESKTRLTSMDILKEETLQFQRFVVGKQMNMQRLMNRCMHLYMTDEDFRKKVDGHTALKVNGLQF